MLNKRFIRSICVALVSIVVPLSIALLVIVGRGALEDDAFNDSSQAPPYVAEPSTVELIPETGDGDLGTGETIFGTGDDTSTLPIESIEPGTELDTASIESGDFPEWGEESREVQDDANADLPGYDDLGALGDAGGLGNMLGQLENTSVPDDMVVFRVYAERDDHVYLKMQSFGDYLGQGWANATPYDALLGGVGSAEYLPGCTVFSSATAYDLEIIPVESIRVNAYYLSYTDAAGIQTSDVYATGDASSQYTVSYIPRYGVPSPSNALTGTIGEYEAAYRQYVYENYLFVDADTAWYMAELIAQQGFDATDPEIITQVATYIQNAAQYNLDYDHSMDQEPNAVIAFLDEYREGVCRHYASAATMLYRVLGIPARYTVGFSADVKAGEITDVTGDRGHAWVEVYIDGVSWCYVEVTGGDGEGGGSGSGEGGGSGSGEGGGSGSGEGGGSGSGEGSGSGSGEGSGSGSGEGGGSGSGEGSGSGSGEGGGSGSGEGGGSGSGEGSGSGSGEGTPSEPEPEKLKLIIKPNSLAVPYDGQMHGVGNEWDIPYTVTWPTECDPTQYVCDLTWENTASMMRAEPGKIRNSIESVKIYDSAGNDVSDLFNIDYTGVGVLHVYIAKLNFISEDYTGVYNGHAQSGTDYPMGAQFESTTTTTTELYDYYWNSEGINVWFGGYSDDFLNECTYTITPVGRTNVGTGDARFDVKIECSEYGDISDWFYCVKTYGQLTIKHAKLQINSPDATMSFDPDADECVLTSPTCWLPDEYQNLLASHGNTIETLDIATGVLTCPGTTLNTISINRLVIRNANGDDVTYNYRIQLCPGNLTMTW